MEELLERVAETSAEACRSPERSPPLLYHEGLPLRYVHSLDN